MFSKFLTPILQVEAKKYNLLNLYNFEKELWKVLNENLLILNFKKNNKLKNNYSAGHNFRIGSELNIKPIFFRTGYSLQGSPNGLSLSGNLVRHSFNVGIGFRAKNNLYFDLTWNRKTTTEDYLLFKTLSSKALIKLNSTSISTTIGFKF